MISADVLYIVLRLLKLLTNGHNILTAIEESPPKKPMKMVELDMYDTVKLSSEPSDLYSDADNAPTRRQVTPRESKKAKTHINPHTPPPRPAATYTSTAATSSPLITKKGDGMFIYCFYCTRVSIHAKHTGKCYILITQCLS